MAAPPSEEVPGVPGWPRTAPPTPSPPGAPPPRTMNAQGGVISAALSGSSNRFRFLSEPGATGRALVEGNC